MNFEIFDRPGLCGFSPSIQFNLSYLWRQGIAYIGEVIRRSGCRESPHMVEVHAPCGDERGGNHCSARQRRAPDPPGAGDARYVFTAALRRSCDFLIPCIYRTYTRLSPSASHLTPWGGCQTSSNYSPKGPVLLAGRLSGDYITRRQAEGQVQAVLLCMTRQWYI